MSGVSIPPEVPEADMKTCVLIDGHALIQTLGKPPGCQTFGDYADALMRHVTHHFGEHITRVDVVFDRYNGDESIKAGTRLKRVGKKKSIRKTIDGPDGPLPQVWSSFTALEDNRADLARFLSITVMQKEEDLLARYELVTGGGFSDATEARLTRRQNVKLHGNHEKAYTRLILHSCEEVIDGYDRILVIYSDTVVLLLLLHFMPSRAAQVWMISGTAKNRKCYPLHSVHDKLSQPVKEKLLGFHALTGSINQSIRKD